METGAVEAVRADDAEGLARRTRLAVRGGPLFAQMLGSVGATGADELVAERVGNVRVGQRADAPLHLFPLLAGNHQFRVRRGASAQNHGPHLNRTRARKRRRNEHVRRFVEIRLRDRHRDRQRPLQLGRPCDDGEQSLVASARPRHRAVGDKPLERCREMDAHPPESPYQLFVEAAGVGEKREPRLRQNATRVVKPKRRS